MIEERSSWVFYLILRFRDKSYLNNWVNLMQKPKSSKAAVFANLILMTSGNCNLFTWYATLRFCIKKHFLQYMILIKHEICSSRVEWYPRFQISEMHNLRPWKIRFVHIKDLSDVWHVYPPAISMRNQYVPSLLYKIQNGYIFAFDNTHLSNISFMNFLYLKCL